MKDDDKTGDKTDTTLCEKENDQAVMTLSDYEGAILLREDGVEIVVPMAQSPETDPDLVDDIVNTLTYMVFALEREDWKDEFRIILEEEDKKEKEAERLAEFKKKRSHLKVIK